MRLFTDHQLSIRQHWRLGCVLLLCFGGVAHSGGALGQSQNPYLADQGTSGLKAQGLGYGHHSDHQNSTTHSRFNPANLILTGDPDANNANSNTPLATLAGSSTITSATLASHSGALKNRFDRSRMTRELRAQTDATQDFGRTLNQIDQGIAAQRAALKSAYQQGKLSAADYQRKDRKWRTLTLASASIGAGLGAPSTSIAGIAAAAASPLAAQQIGTVFKTKAAQNPDGKASNSDRALQALAHGLLAAGVAAAGGNDALSAGLAAAGAEASAPLLAQGFYGTDKPQNLSEAQKTTLKSVARLGGAALGASSGNSSTIAAAGQLAENAVKNNYLFPQENIRYKDLKRALINPAYLMICTFKENCSISAILEEIERFNVIDERRNKKFNTAYADCRHHGTCDKFYFLHVTQRKAWTEKGKEKFKKDWGTPDFDKNWKKLSDSKSMFHNFDPDGKFIVKDEHGHYLNSKYIDRATGQYEVVLDKNNHITKDNTNAGTFNYYSMKNLWGYYHLRYDMDPYTDYGNGGNDKTDYQVRKNLSFLTQFSGKLPSEDNSSIRKISQDAFKTINNEHLE